MIRSPGEVQGTSRNQTNHLAFAALLATSAAGWWQPIVSTTKLALSSDAYTHILLIIPLSLALVYLEREQTAGPGSREMGFALLAAAVLLRFLATPNRTPFSATPKLALSMLALVLWWIGAAVACFGLRILRSHLFALCFLFLLVPLPNNAVNAATQELQAGSAITTESFFRLARVPVMRHGVVLSIPGLDIEVAHECSSIRSSTMLVVITLIFAHLFLRSMWRKTLLVVMAIPLSIAKNAVRIFTITELATRVDPGYLHGKLHHHGGVVFLVLAVMVTVLLLLILRLGDSQPAVAICKQLQPNASVPT